MKKFKQQNFKKRKKLRKNLHQYTHELTHHILFTYLTTILFILFINRKKILTYNQNPNNIMDPMATPQDIKLNNNDKINYLLNGNLS